MTGAPGSIETDTGLTFRRHVTLRRVLKQGNWEYNSGSI